MCLTRRKKEALHEKELGNEAYKQKLFGEAVTHYNRWVGRRKTLWAERCCVCMPPRPPALAAAAACCRRCLLLPQPLLAAVVPSPPPPHPLLLLLLLLLLLRCCCPAIAGHVPRFPLPCSALELYDGDVSFLSNRAAVHFETGDYDACIADCEAGRRRG